MKAGLGEEEQELPDGNKTSYKSLVGHYGHVLSTDKGKEEFAAAWKLLKIFLGKDATDLLDMVRIAYCKILRNNDMHVDRDGQPVANGLNLLSSVVQHSCGHCPVFLAVDDGLADEITVNAMRAPHPNLQL